MENEVKEEKVVEPKKSKTGLLLGILLVIILIMVCGLVFLYKDKLFKKDDKAGSNETTTEQKFFASDYKMTGNGLQNFDLYFMQAENPGKNMIYSPLSIKYALEMLGEGADGDTKAQIDAIVGDYVARKYTNSSHMSFANALFVRDSFKEGIRDNYIDTLKKTYGAELIVDPFKSPDTLNNWVSGKTFKLIPKLMDSLNDLDYVLVNALAIDMEWNKKIQPEHETFDVDFQHESVKESEDYERRGVYVSRLDCSGYYPLEFNDDALKAKSVEIGAVAHKYDIVSALGEESIRKTVLEEYEKWKKEQVNYDPEYDDFKIDEYIKELKSNYKTIGSSTDFLFYDDDEVKAFAKDLKTYDGLTLQYVGIMPKKVGLSDYVKNMDYSKVNNVVNSLKDISLDSFEDGYVTIIDGHIPMFSYEYELKLKDDLMNIGIKDVFDAKAANLSKLSSSDTFIDAAVHKAKIDFSNDGIKAAAATALGGMGAANGGFDYVYDVPLKHIDLTFDKPFMYLIRDKATGEIWFAGNVYEPVEWNEDEDGGGYY